MNPILALLTAIYWLMAGAVAMMAGYLLLLTVAAWLAPAKTEVTETPRHSFAIAIPAHNEELLLPHLLDSLARLDYPPGQVDVHVIADNCSDGTAVCARNAGVTVHARHDAQEIGKGYALQWLIERLRDGDHEFDALVIIDADSQVSSNFLTVMDARLSQGARVIQAYYGVMDNADSWSVGLRAAALTAVHYVRPLGRMVVGASAGLKGNGMVFRRESLADYRWSASITEDIEFHMALVLGGERVEFAPDAIVRAEMPTSLRTAYTQNVRWEQGRLQMIRRYVPALISGTRQAVQDRNWSQAFVCCDAVVEHLIPPFSILAVASLGLLVIALFMQSATALGLTALMLLCQLFYLLSGLIMTRAPRKTYLALLYAPFFLLWKILLYGRVLFGLERQGWVRTAREES